MNGAWQQLIVGMAAGAACVAVLIVIFRALSVTVDDEEALMVTSFGRLTATLTRPGLHVLPQRVMPWVKLQRASLRRDFRLIEGIHVNDARGTSVIVDLWLEYRVLDPAKALFSVEDWDRSLHNLVSHSALAILGNRDFDEILCDRTELGRLLQRDIGSETARWGIAVERMFIRNVSLLPEVSRQVFETVAARLERAKARIEEDGRLRVAKLEADTSARVATLVADAKGQYPEAIGRALATLGRVPAVLAGYNELYELALLRPHRTVAFMGFADGEMRAADAAMVAPPGSSPEAALPPGGPPGPSR